MPYLVTVHQVSRLVVEFADSEDFRQWEDAGACLSDLPPSAVISDPCPALLSLFKRPPAAPARCPRSGPASGWLFTAPFAVTASALRPPCGP